MRFLYTFWLGAQALMALVFALFFAWMVSLQAGFSALLASGVSVFPTLLLASVCLCKSRGASGKTLLLRLYAGEAAKLLLAGALFMWVFTHYSIVPWVFFLVFIVHQLSISLFALMKE
ncbi:MAG: ATP synthase subunit I [Legionellaceae bacterium]|nr:ATP synthase subunit I [Legionellaceae bacterium]